MLIVIPSYNNEFLNLDHQQAHELRHTTTSIELQQVLHLLTQFIHKGWL